MSVDQDVQAAITAGIEAGLKARDESVSQRMGAFLRNDLGVKRERREQGILARIRENDAIAGRRFRRRDDIAKRDAIGDEFRGPNGTTKITNVQDGKVTMDDGRVFDVGALDRAAEGHWVPRGTES